MRHQNQQPSNPISLTQTPLPSSTSPFLHLIWACLRLGRLHTLMGWAIFPAPAIYALTLGFSSHKSQLTQHHNDVSTIFSAFTTLYLRLVICIMSYRSAGLAWDDLIDRWYDARVERTKHRPLPAGDISVDMACLYIAVQSAVTWLLVECLLGEQVLRVTLVGTAIFIPYPFLKRVTNLTQLAGAALIAVGVLQGWAAFAFSDAAMAAGSGGEMGWKGLADGLLKERWVVGLLLAAEFAFELAHELVYGNQDTAEDKKLGLFSLSIFLGPQWSYRLTVMLVFAFVTFLHDACRSGDLAAYQIMSAAVGSLLVWETWLLEMESPASCGRWAKRGVQCKIFLCVALPAAFVVPLVSELVVGD